MHSAFCNWFASDLDWQPQNTARLISVRGTSGTAAPAGPAALPLPWAPAPPAAREERSGHPETEGTKVLPPLCYLILVLGCSTERKTKQTKKEAVSKNVFPDFPSHFGETRQHSSQVSHIDSITLLSLGFFFFLAILTLYLKL